MVAPNSLNNILSATVQDRVNAGTISGKIRSRSNLELVDAESVLHKIISGAVGYYNGEEVITIPAREIAACSNALVNVIERRRMNLGKANPAPAKSESKPKRSRTMPAVTPAPRREEASQVAAAPAPTPVTPEPPVPPTGL